MSAEIGESTPEELLAGFASRLASSLLTSRCQAVLVDGWRSRYLRADLRTLCADHGGLCAD
jgi:hypothetical protein